MMGTQDLNFEIEIINPDHLICNIDVGAELRFECVFKFGFGYASEDENKKFLHSLLPVSLREGWLTIGTQFSNGVLSFIGNVEEVTGGAHEYDILKIQIVTDGRERPEKVLDNAFEILHNQLPDTKWCKNRININYEENDPTKEIINGINIKGPLTLLQIKPNTIKKLNEGNIETIEQLLQFSINKLHTSFKGLGTKKINSLVEHLRSLGLDLEED